MSKIGFVLVVLFTFSVTSSFAEGGKVQHQEEGAKGQGTVARETIGDSAQNKGEVKALKKNISKVIATSTEDELDKGLKFQERHRLRYQEKRGIKNREQHKNRHHRRN